MSALGPKFSLVHSSVGYPTVTLHKTMLRV